MIVQDPLFPVNCQNSSNEKSSHEKFSKTYTIAIYYEIKNEHLNICIYWGFAFKGVLEPGTQYMIAKFGGEFYNSARTTGMVEHMKSLAASIILHCWLAQAFKNIFHLLFDFGSIVIIMASIRSWLACDGVSAVSVRSWLDSDGGREESYEGSHGHMMPRGHLDATSWLAVGSHGHMMPSGCSDATSWLAVDHMDHTVMEAEEHMNHMDHRMGHMVNATSWLAPCPPGEQKVCCFRWYHGESCRLEWLCLTHDGQFAFRRITGGGHIIWSSNLTDFEYLDFPVIFCYRVHQTHVHTYFLCISSCTFFPKYFDVLSLMYSLSGASSGC